MRVGREVVVVRELHLVTALLKAEEDDGVGLLELVQSERGYRLLRPAPFISVVSCQCQCRALAKWRGLYYSILVLGMAGNFSWDQHQMLYCWSLLS